MKKAVVISIFNQKGGCSKTTSTMNIATALTYHSKELLGKDEVKVLVIDMDSQANSSYIALGQNDDEIEENKYITIEKIMLDRSYTIHGAAIPSKFKNIDIVPATIDHAFTDMQCVAEVDSNRILYKRIHGALSLYDYIIIDNPPQIAITTYNSLMVSDYVIAPIEASVFSLKGLKNLVDLMNQINESRDADNRLELISFLAKVDNRKKIKNLRTKRILERVLQDSFIKTEHISMSSTYIDSFEDGETAITWTKKHNGRKEYVALTKAIIKKMGVK